MKTDLALIGQGVVSPAGIGCEALLYGNPISVPVASPGQPENPWPVLRIDLKNASFARWQRESRLRRVSAISFYLVEAAEQALSSVSPADRAETGLIVAFSAGCLAYSRRFFEGIVTQGQRAASPALFPETVFNSPVSHVAAVLGLNGAAYALVGDETAWIAAIKTASVWLRQGRVKQVLVMGAEEFDPIVLDAYRVARWLDRQKNGHGFLASEGAAGLLLRQAQQEDSLVITHARDGLIYRTKNEASLAAEKLLRDVDPALPCRLSAQRNWFASIESNVTKNRSIISAEDQPYLGEAFTASAAWNTLRAVSYLAQTTPRILLPVWGLNHQVGSLELEKRK